MIELKDVSYSLNGQAILKDISLKINSGETAVILGPSGAGKSSILKIIVGLWKPQKGRLFLKGIDISYLSERERLPIRKKMAMVFQSNALFDSLTVEQNVAYFMDENRTFSARETKQRVEECLSFVNMERTGKMFPEELSGGMKKRVAIARAIAFNPDIILYDEPTTGLDQINSLTILELINKIQRTGATSVVVTHIIKDAMEVGKTFTVIEQGRIIKSGSLEDMLVNGLSRDSAFLRDVREEIMLIKNLKSSFINNP
jgi:phospholipid/cholesterol/gamma-HCH transport system ATP-binding protein